MATQQPIHSMSIYWVRKIQYTALLIFTFAVLGSCSQNGTSGGQTMNLSVGEVREVTLPGPGSKTAELTGTSDNSEIVDVTPKPTPAESGTSPATPTTFLVKGITVGTARVVFSEKQPGDAGPGKVVKTYQVRVKTE